jgi:hypothetical protein
MTDTSITRTMRAAIRIGEDFYTLEETITLPADANEAAITQAVALGWQIYRAQRAAAEAQIEEMRGSIVAAPILASEKQRNYIAALQTQAGWSSEQLAHAATGLGFDLATMTHAQASVLIDAMKNNQAAPAPTRTPPKTAAEAQSRFFVRYQEMIGGATWASVQRYLSSSEPMPRTIEGWLAAAKAIQDKGAAPRTMPREWEDAPV